MKLKTGGGTLLAVLAALSFLDYVDSAAVTTLAPDIERTLHLSDGGLGVIVSLTVVLFVVAALPVGVLADRRRRTSIVGICAAVAAVATLLTAPVRAAWQLGLARLTTGAGQSSILPVHNSLLADGYSVADRSRVFTIWPGCSARRPPVASPPWPVVAPGGDGRSSPSVRRRSCWRSPLSGCASRDGARGKSPTPRQPNRV